MAPRVDGESCELGISGTAVPRPGVLRSWFGFFVGHGRVRELVRIRFGMRRSTMTLVIDAVRRPLVCLPPGCG